MIEQGWWLAEIVFFGVVAFLLTREFWIWYFGISRITGLLASIDESLKQLPAVRESRLAQGKQRAA